MAKFKFEDLDDRAKAFFRKERSKREWAFAALGGVAGLIVGEVFGPLGLLLKVVF